MITYQLSCDKCGKVFKDSSENCIDEAIAVLERDNEECETGVEMLCEECMEERSKRLTEEDIYQTERE